MVSAPEERSRDEEFWFEDGNIVLVAGAVEFRILKGILAEHSPVFKDMFSLPQPPETTTQGTQCPVVHLTDSSYDLRHVFRIYILKANLDPFAPMVLSFDELSASIRLGHKYQTTKLVEYFIAYLGECP
ncbi:hypothetical protein BD309DRAFT_995082 [Dichomitus squalens]|nr:uncharacterized protein DICSQDRAFT_171241 [Dichomitus squalens LYAD-421 SS1]EJF60276.1 hypothetical protein DICSQDRAFT_171241 [Dichomitus squalens LYAD-421 SS1]TBU28400.1 hypothetical protein BD311DRAFT_778332 [Dichomitus squalens]TBU37463.1 hypothetical protein BD309DRAFT_995082 [Dichomitus squalens]